jgi:hypothetical protein
MRSPKKPGRFRAAIEMAADARHLRRDRVSTLACPVPAANRLPESASQDWNMVHPTTQPGVRSLLKEAANGYGYG